jgi:hypothetical protein
MDIALNNGIGAALIVVIVAIILDAVFGIIKAIIGSEFDLRKLPQFIATGVLPYLGGVSILAAAAHFVGTPFVEIFYVAVAAIATKYIMDLKDKIKSMYSVEFKS